MQSKPPVRQENRRIVYDKVLDLQKEKQKFEYEFYHRIPTVTKTITQKGVWKVQTIVGQASDKIQFGKRSLSAGNVYRNYNAYE